MFNKKNIVLISFVALLGTSLYAKQDADMISYKDYKEKETPRGVQKKVDNGEKIPKGIIPKVVNSKSTNPKFAKGQIADVNFLNRGTMINTNKYQNINNTDIYRVEDRIFRIARNSREILDILK